MFTGLSTGLEVVMHNRANSGSCRLTHSARTSTGRGTRRRGKPGRPGAQAGRSGSLIRHFAKGAFGRRGEVRTGPRLLMRNASARRIEGNRAGIDERRRGAISDEPASDRSRQDTAECFRGSLRRQNARALNLNGQVPTRTWWGDESTGSTGLSSPRSILAPASGRAAA